MNLHERVTLGLDVENIHRQGYDFNDNIKGHMLGVKQLFRTICKFYLHQMGMSGLQPRLEIYRNVHGITTEFQKTGETRTCNLLFDELPIQHHNSLGHH